MASLFIHLSLSLSLEIFIEYYVLHTGKHTVNKTLKTTWPHVTYIQEREKQILKNINKYNMYHMSW